MASIPQQLPEPEQQLSVERPLGPPAIKKLAGWELFRSMGSPKFVVAPMVDQSELAWRVLSRLHGSNLCYTPMIHSALFSNPSNSRYRKEQFDIETGEEGHPTLDRPLVAQFCSNDKEHFLVAATLLAESEKVDAVDLNLGCPQGIAKRGQYGAFLMEDWDLIESMINHLHKNLSVPITAKFRVYDSLEKTLDYAKMLERAGAQILTVHGRTRDQKGQLTGLADWDKIRRVKEAVSVPVIANGNILTHSDVERCLSATKVDGIMSAEGNLYNPAVFLPLNRAQASSYRSTLPALMKERLDEIDQRFESPTCSVGTVAHHPICQMSLQYLAIVDTLKTQTALSAVKAHLFRMWKPVFSTPAGGKHHELRESLSKISNITKNEEDYRRTIGLYVELTEELARRLEEDYVSKDLQNDPKIAFPASQDGKKVPYSHCQPCLRPLSESEAATATAANKRNLGELQKEEDQSLDATSSATKKLKSDNGIVDNNDGGIQILPPTLLCPNCKINNASSRCVRNVCRSCCTDMVQKDAEGKEPMCEEHLAKERKEQEKKALRMKAKEAKKAKKNEKKGEAKKKQECAEKAGAEQIPE